MAFHPVSGRHSIMHKLGQRLAPGRAVKSITLHMAPRSVLTATVEMFLEEADLPSIEALLEEVQPDVTIVEVSKE